MLKIQETIEELEMPMRALGELLFYMALPPYPTLLINLFLNGPHKFHHFHTPITHPIIIVILTDQDPMSLIF